MAEQQVIDVSKEIKRFENIPTISNLVFPEAVPLKAIPSDLLEKFKEAYRRSGDGVFGQYFNFPGVARWANVLDLSNGVWQPDEIKPYSNIMFVWQIVESGMKLDVSVLPLGAQLKPDVQEKDILEMTNTRTFKSAIGIRVVYDKGLNLIFLKRAFGLGSALTSVLGLITMMGEMRSYSMGSFNNMAELFCPIQK